MPVVEVRLAGFTGETLQNFLVNQVDCKNWKKEITYQFHRYENNTRPVFTISPNPTENQPGNAVVKFLDGQTRMVAFTHMDLARVYCNTDFGRFRTHYLVNDLGNVEEDNVLAANVLLSFEIARRERIPESYPLRRFEVKEAIERVISLWVDNEYDEKVN